MYALISRANLNVGDDLIHVRGRRIVEHVAPTAELVVAKGFGPLTASLSNAQIDQLQAVIVPGGPGARRDIDTIYPFLIEAEARHLPVYFLGVGSRFFPASLAGDRSLLDPTTVARLQRVSAGVPIGVRDHITRRVLVNAGVAAQLNGCPAWYSLPHLNQRPALPKTLSRIAFTTPADLRFVPQCLELMRTTRALLPSASVLVGFHHGVKGHSQADGAANQEIARLARTLRFEIADLAGSSEKLSVYHDCDAHLGYRVHAHIFFSSLRKPTYLLAEDSRGLGVLQTLGGVGLVAWNGLAEHEATRRLALRAHPPLLALPHAQVAEWLAQALERDLDLGFPNVELAARIIDESFRTRMAPFVERIFGLAAEAS